MKRIFPIAFFTAGIALCAWSFLQISEAVASSSWPTVDGQITGSVVKETLRPGSNQSGLRKKSYRPQIAYRYQVDGTVYEAAKVAYGEGAFPSKSPARAVQSRYPVGKPVSVAYNPADPKTAVLEPGATAKAWLLPSAGLILLIFGFLMIRK